ncbi:MAG: hypothetical protein M3Y08_12780 [Fibrobacterota bacterium]|nr:hypothetical protein [Fibrobacterota bacterium]
MVMLAGNTLLTSDQILLSFHHMTALGAGVMLLIEGALVACASQSPSPAAESSRPTGQGPGMRS